MADSWWSGWDSGDGTDADAGSAAQSERFVLDELKDSTSASQPTNERGWKLRGTEVDPHFAGLPDGLHGPAPTHAHV